ncbi:MAG: hypothetical protein PVF40_01785 [Ectothiorhodospiraceae bacterium]|jgi:methyl-accepting chemotaxis protein
MTIVGSGSTTRRANRRCEEQTPGSQGTDRRISGIAEPVQKRVASADQASAAGEQLAILAESLALQARRFKAA